MPIQEFELDPDEGTQVTVQWKRGRKKGTISDIHISYYGHTLGKFDTLEGLNWSNELALPENQGVLQVAWTDGAFVLTCEGKPLPATPSPRPDLTVMVAWMVALVDIAVGIPTALGYPLGPTWHVAFGAPSIVMGGWPDGGPGESPRGPRGFLPVRCLSWMCSSASECRLRPRTTSMSAFGLRG